MEPTQDYDHYPVFEANQVLTSEHLNDIFNYLDDQQRLTRANLLGIGIVCGLNIAIKRNATGMVTIDLTKGTGVTSQGYLIVEPEEKISLGWCRDYQAPDDVGYSAFTFTKNGNPAQYKLWELLPESEADKNKDTLLNIEFLSDKVMLLFVELKKQDLRNCSVNNCDDKGAKISSAVKRLFISKDDLDKIIATTRDSSNPEAALLEQLNLPDIRIQRFNVPNTTPVLSNAILASFLAVFQNGELVRNTSAALSGAYKAFLPFIKDYYQQDPFENFSRKFGFLRSDAALIETGQVRFIQYYYDFFDDLIRAYDEFRWKGVDLICSCCPSGELFPRHLMLGILDADEKGMLGSYRQEFLPSSALTGCIEDCRDLIQLFQRLVEMINQFTEMPNLPKSDDKLSIDPQIRITPSVLSGKKLSEKAIPYYYKQSGNPPLYQLWSIQNKRHRRANQNLSYRYDEYAQPVPPFTRDPLRYDLEAYNFLRIEGHLGKNYQNVLRTLLSLKSKYRLPVDVIALRSGVFDENEKVDLSKESCRFQDLESLYDALREALLTSLCEGVMHLYNIPLAVSPSTPVSPEVPPIKVGPLPVDIPPIKVGPLPVDVLPIKVEPLPVDVPPIKVEPLPVDIPPIKVGPLPVDIPPIKVEPLPVDIPPINAGPLPVDLPPIKLGISSIAASAMTDESLTIKSDISEAVSKPLQAGIAGISSIEIDSQKIALPSDSKNVKDIPVNVKNIDSLDISSLNIPFLNVDIKSVAASIPGGVPKHALLKAYAPNFLYLADTIGAWYEKNMDTFLSHPYIDVDQNHINAKTVYRVYIQLFSETEDNIKKEKFDHVVVLYYLSKLAEIVPVSLDALVYADIANKYQDLLALARYFRVTTEKLKLTDFNQFIPNEDLIDHLDEVLYSCKLGPIKSVHDEYMRRILELKRKQFLSDFLKNNPGIQHKAGVPIGGTFIIVYHEDPTASQKIPSLTVDPATIKLQPLVKGDISDLPQAVKVPDAPDIAVAKPLQDISIKKADLLALTDVIAKFRSNNLLIANPDIERAINVLGDVTKLIIPGDLILPRERSDAVIAKAIDEMVNGTVIADFYLPYQRSCDCDGVQFVLPQIVPTFKVTISCTDEKGNAKVSVTPKGGMEPYSIKVDDNNYVQLVESFTLIAGNHLLLIRDSDNIESLPQTLIVPKPLVISEAKYINDFDKLTYQVSFSVTGGAQPYIATTGTLDKLNVFTSDLVESDNEITVEISDRVGCKVAKSFTHVVERPIFTVQLDCTNSKGMAEINITPQGGIAPYRVQIRARTKADLLDVRPGNLSLMVSDVIKPVVLPAPNIGEVDSQSYAPLVNPFNLAQGIYIVTIKDSEESESLSQELRVPIYLSLGTPTFQCNEDYTAYLATFPILGGTPPFIVNGKAIEGISYTSDPISSGKSVFLEVIDANKCKTNAEASYICVAPCLLPCKGIAHERGYRFWLPEPGAKFSYDILKTVVSQFSIEIEPGKPLDLTTEVQKILIEYLPAASLNKDFHATVVKCLQVINELVAKNISNPDFFILEYQSDPIFPGVLGMLLIEYFECLNFKIEIVSTFTHPNTSGKFRTIYEPGGTSFLGMISAPDGMRIPVIDGIRIDKCTPNSKPVMLCQQAIDLNLKISSSIDLKNNVNIKVIPVGTEVPVAYLCELSDSLPFISRETNPVFVFNLTDFPAKQVRITAFTKNECWLAVNHNIG